MATEKIAVDDVEYEEYDGEIDEAPGGDPDRDCTGESEEQEDKWHILAGDQGGRTASRQESSPLPQASCVCRFAAKLLRPLPDW